MALYLFRALPLELWEPSADDITCVSHWLLFTPVGSVENQLARIILSKLNWGENVSGMQLFLPLELHRRVSFIVIGLFVPLSDPPPFYCSNLKTICLFKTEGETVILIILFNVTL